ncbi:MAG: hypothetical protein JJU29_10650 [Verrucomicrobia bacterium]|nr:hypothetical protein [Verrucomicrobiota bacterium]MCH8511914.1 hypothetical protein [Kiritimatiellia bacterium]
MSAAPRKWTRHEDLAIHTRPCVGRATIPGGITLATYRHYLQRLWEWCGEKSG